MYHGNPTASLESETRRHLEEYAAPDNTQAILHMAPAAVAFVLLPQLAVACNSLPSIMSTLAYVIVLIACALVRVRWFMMFHDLAHGVFFTANFICTMLGGRPCTFLGSQDVDANVLFAEFFAMPVFTSNSYWHYTHDTRQVLNCVEEVDEQNYVWTLDHFQKESRLRKQLYYFVRSGMAKLTYVPVVHFFLNMGVRLSPRELALLLVYLSFVHASFPGGLMHEMLTVMLSAYYGFAFFKPNIFLRVWRPMGM